MERKHVSLVGPTLLVGLGIILLLNNVGYLDWGFWDVVRLWPVLLIAAGLELLLGRRSVWGSIVAAVLVLALLVGGVWLVTTTGGLAPTGGEQTEIAYPLESAESALITLDPAIGELTVSALDDSGNLIEGTIVLRGPLELDQRFAAGDPARVHLTAQAPSGVRLPSGVGGDWQLELSPQVTLDLRTDTGIGATTLDLGQLVVDRTTVDFGIGQATVTLPEASNATVTIDGGIGTVVVEVPEAVGIRLVADTGLVARNVPSNYAQSGETFTSPNYERADYRVELVVSLGIGTLTVRDDMGH